MSKKTLYDKLTQYAEKWLLRQADEHTRAYNPGFIDFNHPGWVICRCIPLQSPRWTTNTVCSLWLNLKKTKGRCKFVCEVITVSFPVSDLSFFLLPFVRVLMFFFTVCIRLELVKSLSRQRRFSLGEKHFQVSWVFHEKFLKIFC